MSKPEDAPRIISMEIGNSKDASYFRILAGKHIKYIIVLPGVLEHDTLLDMPSDFLAILPPLPFAQDTWTTANISLSPSHDPSLDPAGRPKLHAALFSKPLPSVSQWHSDQIDFLDLKIQERVSPLTDLCTWTDAAAEERGLPQTPMVAKMARFWWEIRYVEQESRIYQLIDTAHSDKRLASRFLGHIHEHDRIIGFLLEHVKGRFAETADLALCQAALGRLHGRGLIHGDCNPHNFVIGADDSVTLIGLEKCREANKAEIAAEMTSLEDQLRNGGSSAFVFVEESGL